MTIPMNDFVRQVATMRRELDEAFARVLDSGWFILGKEVEAFEREMAAFAGVSHAIGVGNGMDAIELALRACDIGAGDEVITTTNSAFATALAIVRAGATPVFADIDPQTYSIDPARVEALITPRTRALLPVHIYGQAADLTALETIATRHKLTLIGDAAQAHGATHDGRDVATFGAATCYSFYPTKNLGAFGDGGMVVTNDAKLAERVRRLRNYGQTNRYEHADLGLNSRLDELHAALLRVKLRHLPAHNARRRAISARYRATLADLPVQLPVEKHGESVWHLFVVRTPKRDALGQFLREHGITTHVHYPIILPKQPALALAGSWPVAEQCAQEYLSLPIFPELTDDEIDTVCARIAEFFRG
ncbi:MAG TPA: DegT/DnrJ/EryC1/StrS family aminotransferase [Kofleriaceae bacterium]|nr:DegT/DnrJ/EryC1/StrS family aminotransferase [Kofleriaceae bacterium]